MLKATPKQKRSPPKKASFKRTAKVTTPKANTHVPNNLSHAQSVGPLIQTLLDKNMLCGGIPNLPMDLPCPPVSPMCPGGFIDLVGGMQKIYAPVSGVPLWRSILGEGVQTC